MDLKVTAPGRVKVSVYNIAGQLVTEGVNDYGSAGNYRTQWNGTNRNGQTVGNGLYLLVIEMPDGSRQIQKVIVLK